MADGGQACTTNVPGQASARCVLVARWAVISSISAACLCCLCLAMVASTAQSVFAPCPALLPPQGPKLLMRCRDLVPTGGPVGLCLNAITSNCKQLPLTAGGTLPLVQATQCTSGGVGGVAAWAGGGAVSRIGACRVGCHAPNPHPSPPPSSHAAAPLCSANDQRTFCAYCPLNGGSANPTLCVSSGDACVDTYKARPAPAAPAWAVCFAAACRPSTCR